MRRVNVSTPASRAATHTYTCIHTNTYRTHTHTHAFTYAQARSHDWIVDLSLNVLQAAWLISFTSIIPFRSVYMSLRSVAPHTAAPINALRGAAVTLK